jgi:hypothetical protein
MQWKLPAGTTINVGRDEFCKSRIHSILKDLWQISPRQLLLLDGVYFLLIAIALTLQAGSAYSETRGTGAP